ncbi:MAG: hypothetical protein FJY54_08700 [Betaproteobacteria bacterium]|nr:hypothetical protein [Betaproteobacteria bacterium]
MGEQGDPRSEESLRHEYTEVLLTVRHFAGARQAAFPIFIAIMAGVGLVAFGQGQFGRHAAELSRVAGFLVIAIFWLYEERQSEMLDYCIRKAISLERSLRYTLWTERPIGERHTPRPKLIWRVFFSLVTLLWLYGTFVVPLDN